MTFNIKIGKIKLDNPFILAPMAGITNIAFRILCKNYGAGLVYSEMISSEALIRNNMNTKQLLRSTKKERPLSMQIFGSNPENMAKCAKIIEKKKACDIIDINMGCPAQDIIKQGSGAALLNDQKKIFDITTAVLDVVKIPVTVKIRIGIKNTAKGINNINALETLKTVEEAGAYALGVHGRTLRQGYSGTADWNIIEKVKEKANIPIIGNGDITEPKTAIEHLNKNHCDAIMIGRSAIGNPFIFKEMKEYYENNNLIKQKPYEKIKDYFEYIKLSDKYKLPENVLKTQAHYFTKGLYDSTTIRAKLNDAKDSNEMKMLLKNYYKKLEQNHINK